MRMKSIELRILLLTIFFPSISSEQRIVCYYTNWSVYRHTLVPVLYPDEINPSLCTHIHFAFASINPNTLDIEPSENHDIHYTSMFSTPLYLRLQRLKNFNSKMKFLIAVGGWSAGSEAFNRILTNATTRAMFIRNTKEFLIKWQFDGIDLDWEFPGDIDRGARNDSREQYNILIREMYESFQNDDQQFLMTAAVSANPSKINQGYIVPEFCRYMDYVSIMTYDYHGAWDNVTGMNAPLYGRRFGEGDKRWNVDGSIYYWLNKGCSASKINLGLAMYGRSFTLANHTDSTDIGTEVMGGGLAGPYTKENGTLAYFEICKKLRVHNWTHIFDADAQAPYAYSSSDKQWVGFDDLKSITLKVLYAQSLNLGGVMLWSLDQDDYNGLFCGEGEFPLTRRVHDVLRSFKNPNDQELAPSSIATDPSESPVTPENRMLIPTESSSNWFFFNRSSTNHRSFYLFLIVFLFI